MKAKDIKTWTKALRSGEYKQTKEFLHHNDGFCCLGVLLDVMVEGDWIRPIGNQIAWRFKLDETGETIVGLLPSKVRSDFNISAADERLLARMNDSGTSFEEIADWIESNLSKV